MYIQIERESIWEVYTEEIAKHGLFRGGGSASSAKMYKKEGEKESVREADFKIVYDKSINEYMVYPDITKGLSFSNSLQRLQDLPIRGKVWRLPRGESLPEGLVINYRTIDHPLVNVKYKMPMPDLISKLKELERKMEFTGVNIT
jgi:hypothetical protein